MDQIGSDWIKISSDSIRLQIASDWRVHQIGDCIRLHQIRFDQIGLDQIGLDRIASYWIRSDQMDQIGSDWIRMDLVLQ